MHKLIVLWACLVLPGVVHAWNATGHMTVSKLAWDRLSAQQRTEVMALLAEHPHWEMFFKATPRPEKISESEFQFAIAGVWPDWLRGYARAKDEVGKKVYLFHKGPRHYINWPFVRPSDKELFEGKTLEYDAKENIILGIDRAMEELKSEKFSPKYRAVSLCWLLHLTGDIHQPLHNVGLFTKYTPTNDQGGNLFWVKVNDVPTRLHGYWDDILGSEVGLAQAFPHAANNCEILTRPEYDRDKYAKELAKKKVEDWSKDAFKIAVDVGYRGGELKGWLMQRERESDEQKAKAPPLPADYPEQAERAARRQAALAGHRLLDQLEEVFPRKK